MEATETRVSVVEGLQYELIEQLLINQKDNLSEEEYYEIDACLYNKEVKQYPKIIEFLKSKQL